MVPHVYVYMCMDCSWLYAVALYMYRFGWFSCLPAACPPACPLPLCTCCSACTAVCLPASRHCYAAPPPACHLPAPPASPAPACHLPACLLYLPTCLLPAMSPVTTTCHCYLPGQDTVAGFATACHLLRLPASAYGLVLYYLGWFLLPLSAAGWVRFCSGTCCTLFAPASSHSHLCHMPFHLLDSGPACSWVLLPWVGFEFLPPWTPTLLPLLLLLGGGATTLPTSYTHHHHHFTIPGPPLFVAIHWVDTCSFSLIPYSQVGGAAMIPPTSSVPVLCHLPPSHAVMHLSCTHSHLFLPTTSLRSTCLFSWVTTTWVHLLPAPPPACLPLSPTCTTSHLDWTCMSLGFGSFSTWVLTNLSPLWFLWFVNITVVAAS